MANNTSETDISVEVLQEDLPLRRNMYGSVVSLFVVSKRFDRFVFFTLLDRYSFIFYFCKIAESEEQDAEHQD